jgi:hypothetical protein
MAIAESWDMRLLLLFVVSALAVACGVPCERHPQPISSSAVCVMTDAGTFAADAGFTLKAWTNADSTGSCGVDVNHTTGTVTLALGFAVTSCDTGTGFAAPRREPPFVLCTIPPLAEGQHTINTEPQTTFTLPAGDAGLPPCL